MSGEFDVFDEWGAYVGKFTPAGGGWDGCLFAIAMLFLWTAGFLAYLLVRLVVQGFRAAGRKEWDKALAYWAIPGLIVGVFVLSSASGEATQAAQEAARKERYEQAQAQAAWALANPTEAFSVRRIGGSEYSSCVLPCRYGEYEFTNNTATLRVWDRGDESGSCFVVHEGGAGDSILSPGETWRVNCMEEQSGKPVASCMRLLTTVEQGYHHAATLCVEGVPLEIRATEVAQENARIEAIRQQVAIENAQLIEERVIRAYCESWGEDPACRELTAVRYSIVNRSDREIVVRPSWHYDGPGRWLSAENGRYTLSPRGGQVTIYQFLSWAGECVGVSVTGTDYEWEICPIDYLGN